MKALTTALWLCDKLNAIGMVLILSVPAVDELRLVRDCVLCQGRPKKMTTRSKVRRDDGSSHRVNWMTRNEKYISQGASA
jgi:hypothetical protein